MSKKLRRLNGKFVTDGETQCEYIDLDEETRRDHEARGNGGAEELLDYSARQSNPLEEQTLGDFNWLFQGCEGLTYLFVCRDRLYALSPTLIDAIVLTDAARFGSKFVAPYGWGPRTNELRGRVGLSDVPKTVEDRVREMNRRGVEFVLIWHWCAEESVHIDASPNYSEDNYLEDIADYLAEELRFYMSTW